MKKKECNLSALIVEIIKGDEAAFRELFDRYYQPLFHHALYYHSSKEQAEEVVLDVFYTIWKKKDLLVNVNNIESYLYSSVKNQALHYIRRTNEPEKHALDLYHIELIPDTDNPESSLLEQEQLDLIQKAIDTLPDKCREVFRLTLSDKLKHEEIARLMGISKKTVEAHVATAYRKIRTYVKRIR